MKNLGPALAIGDEFTLFSKPLQGREALLVKGSGAIWTNHLATDGAIPVIGFLPSQILNFTNTGENALQFSWTGDFKLQIQNNKLDVGIEANWAGYPAGGTSPVIVPIGMTNGTVFFRLAPQP